MSNILGAEGFLLAVFVLQALVGERGVIFATICAAVLQWESAKIIWIECFVRFMGFVGQSGSFMLVENIAFNYSPSFFFFNSSFKGVNI